jgi:transcription antitermination factor NusB
MSSVSYTPREMRISVFHLLYAAQACNYESSVASIADNLRRCLDEPIDISESAIAQADQIIAVRHELDDAIRPLLDNWRIERLSVCTHLILQMAMWEFLYTTTDRIVIINEAIELAKLFAEDDAHKFINGVLDRWIKLQQFNAQ